MFNLSKFLNVGNATNMQEHSSDNSRKEYYEYYSKHRESLLELRTQQYSSFDKYLLSLSSATIGISLFFLKDIVQSKEIVGAYLLYWSWALLSLSMLTILLSFLIASSSIEKEIENWDAQYMSNGNVDDSLQKNALAGLTKALNWIACFALVFGVVLLCLFAGQNT